MTNTAPMLHRVHNFAPRRFEQAKSTLAIEDGHERAVVTGWVSVPAASDGQPGEAVLDDEMLAFLRASPVCSHWLRNDPVTDKPQVVVVESFAAPETA